MTLTVFLRLGPCDGPPVLPLLSLLDIKLSSPLCVPLSLRTLLVLSTALLSPILFDPSFSSFTLGLPLLPLTPLPVISLTSSSSCICFCIRSLRATPGAQSHPHPLVGHRPSLYSCESHSSIQPMCAEWPHDWQNAHIALSPALLRHSEP
jgi:hypothetical protein